MSKVRIGIDVGGTFTDAAVIDDQTYELIAKLKIPTTHEEGVALGIIKIIQQLLEENNIKPDDVVFIAHGTTQATNALLEGDVASVGIIGMGTGFDARGARKETNVEDIELAPQKFLKSYNEFIDSNQLDEAKINEVIDLLVEKGAEVIVASEAYSVDNPENENRVIDQAKQKSLFATGGHEISQLYGLKMRTRTAVVNASLIPRMMQTANMTEQAVVDSKIKSNLMIMRCDGGVMSINEVRKRPILTMLSGLAAGVAGALMYEKISDGIFFEVGGTSIDISVIKNGKVMIKYAQVGGHKTYLQSLDVRTLAVAGGSMIRLKDGRISDVGPRSAHIANLDYEVFTSEENIQTPRLELISPKKDDPQEYVKIACEKQDYSLTLAGAANILGYIDSEDYAYGNVEAGKRAWEVLAKEIGTTIEEAARQVMDTALDKLIPVMDELISEYELDRKFIVLVGGGGSGSVVVPALAEKMNVQFRIAKNAPYISTIGVALAMVREQIERTIANPTDQDIKQIRTEVIDAIIKSGANEATIDVNIEIDSQKNILRAIATGSTELRSKDLTEKEATKEEKIQIAADALISQPENIEIKYTSGRWTLLDSVVKKKKFLFNFTERATAVIDREGVVRFKHENVFHQWIPKAHIEPALYQFIDDHTTYSDANATLPKVFLFYNEKMLDLTGMQTIEQLKSIVEVELEHLKESDEVIAVAYK